MYPRVQVKHDKGATRALRNVSTVFSTSPKVMNTLNTFLISDENTLKCDVPNHIAEAKKKNKARVGTCEITEYNSSTK